MTTKQNNLFPRVRSCICCTVQIAPATRGERPSVRIVGINPYLYYRGVGKAQLRCGEKVQICEECLVKAVCSSLDTPESATLAAALFESLAVTYSGLVEDDEPIEKPQRKLNFKGKQQLQIPEGESE